MVDRRCPSYVYSPRALAIIAVALLLAGALMHMVGFPTFFIVGGIALFLLSMAVDVVTGIERQRTGRVTSQRLIAHLVVLPIISSIAALLLLLLGLKGWPVLVMFFGVLLGCNVVYYRWFDRGSGPSDRPSPCHPDVSQD